MTLLGIFCPFLVLLSVPLISTSETQSCQFDVDCPNCQSRTVKRCEIGRCGCINSGPTNLDCIVDGHCPFCNDLTKTMKRCENNKCTCLNPPIHGRCAFKSDCPRCAEDYMIRRCLNHHCECIQQTCTKLSECPFCHEQNTRRRCYNGLCYCT